MKRGTHHIVHCPPTHWVDEVPYAWNAPSAYTAPGSASSWSVPSRSRVQLSHGPGPGAGGAGGRGATSGACSGGSAGDAATSVIVASTQLTTIATITSCTSRRSSRIRISFGAASRAICAVHDSPDARGLRSVCTDFPTILLQRDDPGVPLPPVRLVATDLDGTLLGPGGRLSPRTLAALGETVRAGITVVAATGRSFRTAVPRVAPSPALRHLVCSNGAVLYDRASATVVEHHPLAPAAVPAALAALRAGLAGVRFGWESPSGWAWETAFVDSRPVIDDETDAGAVVDALGPPFPPVTKLFAGHPELVRDDLLAAVAPLVADGLVVSCSGAAFVEITGAGVDKAFGVARMCDRLGVDRDEVVAIGDHLNDVALLRWAGRSVAMAGGHPEALAAAGEVTASCADDGAAAVVESIVAGART